MSIRDDDLHRLLRSAASGTGSAGDPEMPFGFDTRVVALAFARARGSTTPNGSRDLIRFVRRAGAIAFAVLAVASAGAFQQFVGASFDADETPLSEAYAIADNAIQVEVPELTP
jgi:hypothetical protein